MNNDKQDLILKELQQQSKQQAEQLKEIKEMKTNIKDMKTDIKDMKADIGDMKSVINKGIYIDITKLEKRVDDLEHKQEAI